MKHKTVKLVVYVPDTQKKVHPYEEVAFDVYPLVLNPHKTTYNKKQ